MYGIAVAVCRHIMAVARKFNVKLFFFDPLLKSDKYRPRLFAYIKRLHNKLTVSRLHTRYIQKLGNKPGQSHTFISYYIKIFFFIVFFYCTVKDTIDEAYY